MLQVTSKDKCQLGIGIVYFKGIFGIWIDLVVLGDPNLTVVAMGFGYYPKFNKLIVTGLSNFVDLLVFPGRTAIKDRGFTPAPVQ